ncbi:vacuole effluxer Atg22 like protein [Nitzschia inconspicua]|uniref:Vacuole effluxer Atg22 like protein n=1 Tax=Nitzschia inconspicua TaxID=303405 RepID=A0A9K3PAK6_9STRA|nr:vacuole effluxer Atg22 like protein [Nitzschia inconspicua]
MAMTTIIEPIRTGDTMAAETGGAGSGGGEDLTHIAPVELKPEQDTSDINQPRKCCGCFLGNEMAIGYNTLGMGRGGVVMSNIYLAGSLIYLACKESGGVDPLTDECEDSDLTVRGGMKPSALISNIAIISGLLSAFLMPIFGAIVDYTHHRKLMGIISMAILTTIQGVQIATIESTWFSMAILQAIAGFIYQVQVVSTYAYLPEMAREVGQKRMNNYTAIFTQTQFGSQATFTILVVGISIGLSLSTVHTAMVGQAAVVLWCAVFLTLGWKHLPARPARHDLNDKQWLITAGFSQNWNTAKAIWSQYRKGLKWLGCFVSPKVLCPLTQIFLFRAVIYLTDVVGLSITQVGIFFLVALLGTIPGAKLGSIITNKTNLNTSWKLSQICLLIALIIGAFVLDDMKGPKELCYLWGISVGILLGWFYPTENLFFSMCLPQGQETELAGFFVYCTQILGWLPPLIFTVLVQSDVDQKYGVISTSFGFLVAVLFLSCTGSWDEILVEADHNQDMDLVREDVHADVKTDLHTCKKVDSDEEETAV